MTNTSMTVDEAFKIAGGFVEADKNTFTEAMDVIKKHNDEIINKTKNALETKDENALMSALDELEKYDASLAKSLREAYRNKEEDTFSSTLDARKDEIVNGFREMHDAESAIIQAKDNEEKINVNSEVLAQNTEFLYTLLDNGEFSEKLEKDILEDSEVKEAIDSTVIVDYDEPSNSMKEISVTNRDEHFKMLIEKAKLDVFIEQSKSKEFSEKTDDEKKASLFDEVKMSFLGSVTELRTASQFMNTTKEASEAVEKQDETFFQKQLEALGRMAHQDVATKYASSNDADVEKVQVPVDLVVTACADTEKKAKDFEDTLGKFASASSKNEDVINFNKAWQKVNSFRTSFASKARQIWGQRYEFARGLKDRAPKVATDIAATVTLVGATATQAPWLGTAVLAYGAYKATSAWVWPIVTKARKNAREEKKAHPKVKTKFVDHLREATSEIFNKKEERKKYFKEAAWGSVAGLVGLGAAGVVGTAAGALAAKSAQSLSSLAVNSVNNAIETIGTLKDKDKGFWDKAWKFGGTLAAGGLLYYFCKDVDFKEMSDKVSSGFKNFFSNDGAENIVEKTPETIVNKEVKLSAPTAEVADSAKIEQITTQNVAAAKVEQDGVADAINSHSAEQSAEETVKVKATTYNGSAESWTKETGVTERQWEKLRAIWGGPEQYEEFYNRISDDMLKEGGMFEGMTREQVLFKYQRLASWNLPAHQGTIDKLNDFFRCGKTIELGNEDYNVINSVTKTGAIEGVVGQSNTVVEHLDAECNSVNVTENEVTKTTLQSTAKTGENFTSLGKGEDVDLTTTQNEQLTLNKANGLGGNSKVIDKVDSTEVTAKAQNVNVVTNAKNTASIIEGSLGQETDFNPQDEASLFSNQGKGEDISISSDNDATTLNKGNGLSGKSEVIKELNTTNVNTNTQNVEVVTNAKNTGSVVEGTPGSEENFEFGSENEEDLFTNLGRKEDVNLDTNASIVEGNGVEEDFNPNGNGSVQTPEGVESDFEVITKTEEVVIEGTEDVEIGTKAAGNIEERGGFEYTGLSEEQYNATKAYYQDKFGNGAYDRFAARITDDMRARGGIFEGLSVEQSMFAMKQITSWGYGETGQFNQEVDSMFSYLKGCEGTISEGNAEKFKALVDRVNEDGSMEGITGKKAIMTRHFVVGDCGEASSLVTEKALEGHTEGSGDALNRLFMKPQIIVVSHEPIFSDLGKGSDLDFTSTEQLDIAKLKANNLDGVKVVDSNVSAEEITDGIVAENKEVVTDKGSIKQTEASGELGKGSIKTPEAGKEEDFVADANKNRTYNGKELSKNTALAGWQRKIFE